MIVMKRRRKSRKWKWRMIKMKKIGMKRKWKKKGW
jgi:hypothetical protein